MFKVDFTPDALKDISALDKATAKRIVERIDWFKENFDAVPKEALKGKLSGKFKLRVGDWRVIYSFESKTETITVYAVEHRSKVYRL